MARIRSLKPEAFQSESLARVSVNAERTMFGLSTQADDRGRYPDKPAVLNGAIWPMRPGHDPGQLETELNELVRADILCRYVGCDGKHYIHLVTWDRHHKIEKPSRSRLPRCPHHPVSVTGVDEKCGVHGDAPCPIPEPSPNGRGTFGESSDTVLTPLFPSPEGAPAADSPVRPASHGHDSTVANTSSSEGPSPNPPRNVGEASPSGPRTLDHGPITFPTGTRVSPTPPRTFPEVETGDDRATVVDEDPGTSPAQRAFGIAREWINRRRGQGTPVVMRSKGDPLHALRTLIEPFAVQGYADAELKTALDTIGESLPSAAALDRVLTRQRTGRRTQHNTAMPESTAPRRIPRDQVCAKHPGKRAVNCGLCRADRLAGRPETRAS